MHGLLNSYASLAAGTQFKVWWIFSWHSDMFLCCIGNMKNMSFIKPFFVLQAKTVVITIIILILGNIHIFGIVESNYIKPSSSRNPSALLDNKYYDKANNALDRPWWEKLLFFFVCLFVLFCCWCMLFLNYDHFHFTVNLLRKVVKNCICHEHFFSIMKMRQKTCHEKIFLTKSLYSFVNISKYYSVERKSECLV